jgi:uncharacterized repeat protein (TIGR03943 family)
MRKMYGFITIIFLGVYILFLYLDPRRLYTYTTERYYYTILISAIFLIIVGLVGIYYNRRKKIDLAKLKERNLWIVAVFTLLGIAISPLFFLICAVYIVFNRNIQIKAQSQYFKPALLSLVIFLGIIIPSGQISSATADQRISNLNSVVVDSSVGVLNNFNSDTKTYDIGDWITSQNYNTDLNYYNGKEVDLVGFIFAPEFLPDNYFLISRFVIRCCAADATPLGLVVKYDWNDNFAQDEWVRIQGTFSVESVNGKQEMVIIPTSMERSEIPERPYIN